MIRGRPLLCFFRVHRLSYLHTSPHYGPCDEEGFASQIGRTKTYQCVRCGHAIKAHVR